MNGFPVGIHHVLLDFQAIFYGLEFGYVALGYGSCP